MLTAVSLITLYIACSTKKGSQSGSAHQGFHGWISDLMSEQPSTIRENSSNRKLSLHKTTKLQLGVTEGLETYAL